MSWTRSLVAAIALAPSTVAGQSATIDSLLQALQGQQGRARFHTLSEVQWVMGFFDPQRALAFGAQETRLAQQLGDSALIAQAANDLAITEYRLGHLREAVALNLRALRIRRALMDSAGMAASHSKAAVAYIDLMAFDSALAHSYSAARIYAGLGDVLRSAQVRGNIGLLYQQMSDLPAAERAIRQALAELEPYDNDYAMGSALGQLVQVLAQQDRIDEALLVAAQARERFKRVGSKIDLAMISNELGQLSRKRGNNAAGLAYYREALRMGEEAGDMTGVATYALNVANVLNDMGLHREALPYYARSLALCRQEGYSDQLMSALEGAITAHERMGDARTALALQKELLAARDSVYRADRLRALSDMQVKYETERTERELAEERQRGLERENRIVRQRLFIAIAVGAALVTLLVAGLVVARQRALLKAERDAALIAERERGLKAIIESTEAERKRVAHELHDGVGQVLTGLKLRIDALAKGRPDWAEVAALAAEAGAEVRSIAHRMMPRALGELGLAPALGDMLEKTLVPAGVKVTYEHHGMRSRLPAQVEVGIYRIAQELAANAAKHAAATQVNVQLLRNKGNIVLIMEDNGRGFDPRAANGGMGMNSLHDRARLIEGTLTIETAPGKGTIATLRVPLTSNGEAV
ncbi:MAG: tetratricopeptide repeat protein [Flavobacteriales bacterium]